MASPALTKLSIDNAKQTEAQRASASIRQARANKNAGGVREGGTYVAPDKPAPTLGATATAQTAANTPPSTITSTSMTPTTPTTLADGTQATQAQGMMTEFTDATDTYTKDLEAKTKALEAPKANALSDYLSQLQGAKGLSQLTAESYAGKGGVDDITPELNDINDKIRREQLSMRRQTEAVQKNMQGRMASGVANEVNRIERESFAKQADLAVIQQAVQGRYDSAKEIADRAVTAQLEQQTNDLAIKKFNYEENKEAFTAAEQRSFEAAQGDRERKLEAERQNKQDMYELGIQASADGAPSSVVSQMFKAKTREEALAIGGSYIGALDREAKRASIEASRASTASSYDAIAARAEQNKALLGTLNGKSQTEGERLTEVYANRMNEANGVVEKLGSTFAQPKAIFGSLLSSAGAPSILQSAERQQYEQAQRNFLNAVLRKESGAVISPEEFSSGAKQYFPQAGDSTGVLAQKTQNRNTAISGLYAAANVPMPELEAAPVGTPLQTTSGISYTILPNQ